MLNLPSEVVKAITVTGIWDTQLWFQPAGELSFRCRFIVAQTLGQGCAFYANDVDARTLSQLVGTPLLHIGQFQNVAIQAAILDSIFASGSLVRPAEHVEVMDGSPDQKAGWRSSIVTNEAQKLLQRSANIGRIALVGASFLLEGKLRSLGCRVDVFDLDPVIVGSELPTGAIVQHGDDLLHAQASYDVAVMTGMTLTTGTLELLSKRFKDSGATVLIYAQTGANIASFYGHWGVDTAVCEPIPFYNFQGQSRIAVHRFS